MNILAFDTSTSVLSIALRMGESLLTSTRNIGLKHSETLLPLIARLFEDSNAKPEELDVVVCTKGPGSFTGLRIGMATAKGLAAGANCPLVSVPTLDCFAYRFAFLSTPVIPLINAKKHRFYAALYQEGKQKTDYLDADMEEINALVSQYTEVILTGPDASAFRELYPERDYLLDPLASLGCAHDLIHLGETRYQSVGPDDTTEGPLYIRKSDAELLFEKKKQ